MVSSSNQTTLLPVRFKAKSLWNDFQSYNNLTDQQVQKFQQYADLLLAWNKLHNITAITKLERVVSEHFQDSLMLIHARDISNSTGVVDIGSGGGLPGIPLALALPNLPVTLIEVSQKKIAFLEQTVKALELHNVTIFEYDWRTFLKTTTLPIQYLCARASLPVKELGRAFKPSSPYKDSTLVYWASRHWQMPNNLPLQIEHQANYVLIGKERNLAFIKPKA